MVEFDPESAVGQQLKVNLTQELQRKYNFGDDAADIAEYISVLIANGSPPAEILQEVNGYAPEKIDEEFLGSVFREIVRLLQEQGGEQQPAQPAQPEQLGQQPVVHQQEAQQQPAQVPQPQVSQPVQQSVQQPAQQPVQQPQQSQQPQPFQQPVQLPFQQQPQPQQDGQAPPTIPPFVFDPTQPFIPTPFPMDQVPSGPKRLPGGPRATRGRGGISKGTDRNARTTRNFALKNGQNMEQMLTKATNVNFIQKTSKGRCKDFPYCNNKECEFAHPTKNCFAYPNCSNPPGTCNYLHPDEDQELIAKLEKSKQEYHDKKKQDLLVLQGSCKFGMACTKDTCPFAHPTPANGSAKISTLDWCPSGKTCPDPNCSKAHPPPPSARPVAPPNPELAFEQCKFGTSCTNYKCPRRHATSLVPCRAGTLCRRLDCTFAHPINEICRFAEKCQNKNCLYQHPANREIQSNTWSKEGGAAATTNSRTFAVPEDQVMEQAVQQ